MVTPSSVTSLFYITHDTGDLNAAAAWRVVTNFKSLVGYEFVTTPWDEINKKISQCGE